MLRVHGSKPKYYHKVVGGNFRLDSLQAAVLSVKLGHLDEWTARRQQNASYYDTVFQEAGLVGKGLVTLPKPVWKQRLTEGNFSLHLETANFGRHYHIYNQYVISTSRRNELKSYLTSKDVGTAIYYPVPLHLQKCFATLGYQAGSFPVSEEAAERTLALPIYPELTSEQQDYVVDAVVEGLS
jgi:dTDP-4-amino-4,6-dideoxygalactose transaminase